MNFKNLLATVALVTAGVCAASGANAAGIFALSVKTDNGSEFCNGSGGACSVATTGGAQSISTAASSSAAPLIHGVSSGGERFNVNVSGNYTPTSNGFNFSLGGVNVEHLNGTGGTVQLALTYTGLTAAGVNTLVSQYSDIQLHGSPAATFFGAVFISNTNTAFGTDTLETHFGNVFAAPAHPTTFTSTGPLTDTAALSAGALYSVTTILDFYFKPGSNGSNVSFALGNHAVPEPGTLALFGLGLLLMGLFVRKRTARAV